jgi:hypothetical protein
MIVAFLACLGMAVASRNLLKAAIWVAVSPIVAIVAPIGIVGAAIAVVLWLVFVGVPRLVGDVREHIPHRPVGTYPALPA